MQIIFDYNRTIFNPETQELYPGVFELLNYLYNRHDLFLISHIEKGREDVISGFGIEKFFKKIIFAESKSIQIFSEIIKTKTKQTIIVGDRIRGEIAIGNELRCITVWLKQGKFKEEGPRNKREKPTYTINDISELKEITGKYESN